MGEILGFGISSGFVAGALMLYSESTMSRLKVVSGTGMRLSDPEFGTVSDSLWDAASESEAATCATSTIVDFDTGSVIMRCSLTAG